MVGIHHLILAHKEALEGRSKKPLYPAVLWVLALYHANFPQTWNLHHKKFNQCLESVADLFPEMGTLKLLKIWDYNDSSLFSDHWFTAKGLTAIWESFDSAFRHWDTFVCAKKKNKLKKRQMKSVSSEDQDQQRQFNEFVCKENQLYKKWKSSGNSHWLREDKRVLEGRRQLPRPRPSHF